MLGVEVSFLTIVMLVVLSICRSNADESTNSTSVERLYFMKKLGGSGCPYMASWFVHVNHFRRVQWWIDKMEAASFKIFDYAKLKFQLSDPDAYFVHHMSMYEHFNHKKYGFETAKNKTLILSQAAMHGECDELVVSKAKNIVSFVPFYGGLPPGVTKDLTVKSTGQGNSLVDASTKALQTLATICSCLKYFGNVIVGVARTDDKDLIIDMLSNLPQTARHHVNVVLFQMAKPSHLPFHMLAWGQQYIYHHNCKLYYDRSLPPLATDDMVGFTAFPVATNLLPNSSEYDICYPNAIAKYHGGPVKVSFVWKNLTHIDISKHSNSKGRHLSVTRSKTRVPLKFAYYSESDQIVHFDNHQTLNMMISAVNESTFFTGRRKEKVADSEPSRYMGGLNVWRECGASGYLLRWPESHLVYQESR